MYTDSLQNWLIPNQKEKILTFCFSVLVMQMECYFFSLSKFLENLNPYIHIYFHSTAIQHSSENSLPAAGGAAQRPAKEQSSRRKDEAKQATKKPKENALSQFDLNNYASQYTFVPEALVSYRLNENDTMPELIIVL